MRFLLAVAAGALCVAAAPAVHAAPGTVPTHFEDQLVAGPMNEPVAMAFLPDGRLLVCELKTARIRLIVNGAIGAIDPIAVIDSVVTLEEEEGLSGIAIDPQWPSRPFVYVVYDAIGSNVRISRYTATGDLTAPASSNLGLPASSRFDLLRDIPDLQGNHNGGSLRFGIDGMLYAGLADDAVECSAQDPTTLRGVLVRLNVANLPAGPGVANKAALVPPDNPWAADPIVNKRLVWVFGFRNPFRMDVDRVTGEIFIADVGWNQQEEIDLIDTPGQNYGWSFFEGTYRYQIDLNECGIPVPASFRDPIHSYDHDTSPFTTECVIGGAVHRPVACADCNFPAEYDGDYFFSDYYAGFLRRLKRNGSTWSLAPAVPGQPNATDWGRNFDQVTEFVGGPDGALWYARMTIGYEPGTGEIRRIVYAPPSASVPPAIAAPVRFASPVPSPSRGETSFSWALPRGARVGLTLHDVHGRHVRTLVSQDQPAGAHSVRWDGRDQDGNEVRPGLYLARLMVDNVPYQQRLPLIR